MRAKTGPKPRSAIERFEAKVRRAAPDACWLWTGATTCGYGVLSQGGRGARLIRAHRFAWEHAHGPVPAGLCVLHRCDVRACVNPAHLFLGTHRDNTQDMIQKGRRAMSRKKLSDAEVRDARARVAAGETQRAVARAKNVSFQLISAIMRGKARRSVSIDPD